MAIPQVVLPVPFEQIPAEVERLRLHAYALDGEARVTRSLIAAVQEGCTHPQDKQRRWTDYGGDSNTECQHCGRRW